MSHPGLRLAPALRPLHLPRPLCTPSSLAWRLEQVGPPPGWRVSLPIRITTQRLMRPAPSIPLPAPHKWQRRYFRVANRPPLPVSRPAPGARVARSAWRKPGMTYTRVRAPSQAMLRMESVARLTSVEPWRAEQAPLSLALQQRSRPQSRLAPFGLPAPLHNTWGV